MARRIPILFVVACLSCNPSSGPVTEEPQRPQATAPGLVGGVDYLLKHQSEDGAWRSDVYATFKDGTALTPLVLCSLQDAADFTDSKSARRKASEWLARRVKPDGTIDEGPEGLPYPVYTAALSVTALSHPDNRDLLKQRDAWLKYLLDRQLTEKNGWAKDKDLHYGGWGYFPGVPKKPMPGQIIPAQQLLESNLSATTYALDAVAAVRDTLTKESPTWNQLDQAQSAPGHLLLRLQNWPKDGLRDEVHDGGFHFIFGDPVRNKAGVSTSNDPAEGVCFYSYGSATADGVRAFYHAGLRPFPPEGAGPASVAKGWLVSKFQPDHHPGTYIPTHERNRDAVYFYYARSVAKSFRLLDVQEVNGRHWAHSLFDALLARQHPDGSWSNSADQQRENDPVLATAYAVSALAECRRATAKSSRAD